MKITKVRLEYMVEKFEYSCIYNEKEVNNIIESYHTFGDYFLLRRDLIESGLLSRTRVGQSIRKQKIIIKNA